MKKNTKKILLISNMYPSNKHPYYGSFVKNTTKMLEHLGYNVNLIVIKKTENKILKLLYYMLFYIKSFFIPIIFNYEYTYIHFVSLSSITIYYAKKIKPSINIIANIHGNDLIPDSQQDYKRLKYSKRILSEAKKIIVPSDYFKNHLINHYPDLQSRVHLYPSSGIDVDLFYRRSRQECIDYFNLNKNDIYIGYISRIEKDKGWDTFLDMMSIVKKNNLNWKGIVVGDGTERELFNEKMRELNLHNVIIKFPLLSQSEIAKIYNVLDVFCFPTYRKSESLGLVGLEAMASHCIVLASDFGGPKTYIENGINGFLFQPQNSYSMFEKIKEIFSLNEMKKNVILSNAFITSQKYSQSSLIKKLEIIFNDKE